jgi:hypothetical protein
VGKLVQKCRAGGRVSESEDMGLVGILSTQLLHHLFVEDFAHRPIKEVEPMHICRRKEEGLEG